MCGMPVRWHTMGHDQWGSIRELVCTECEWEMDEDDMDQPVYDMGSKL